MKIVIIQVAIRIFQCLLTIIYSFFKLCPIKTGKVLFCSRQSDETPLDFLLLKKSLEEKHSEYSFVVICNRLRHDVVGYMFFFWSLLKSMYHLATSNICILDSYWPTVSMLKHKDKLTIIQIWHSIGKMKKSGYQALDKKSGRKSAYAKLLKMHNNYDYLVGGAEYWNKYYCEAFNIEENQILNFGLPRIDYLIDKQEENTKLFYEAYPELKEKKVVLYAPTFRKNMKSNWNQIANVKIYNDIVIIIKNHPGQHAEKISEHSGIVYINNWKTIDLLSVCDYLITDYSSIALEAAVLKKKTFFWTYDYDEYIYNSGINIDLRKEMSENLFKNLEDLIDAIENDNYSFAQQKQYVDKYLLDDLGNSTDKITDFIINLIRKEEEKDEVYYHGRWKGTKVEEIPRSV